MIFNFNPLISILFIVFFCAINCINALDQIIFVLGNDFANEFYPKRLIASVGDTVMFETFNTFGSSVDRIVQADGPAVYCKQSTNPGAFDFTLTPENNTYTIPLGSAGTINYFCNVADRCRMGMWGSIEVIDSHLPSSPDSGSNPPDIPADIPEEPTPSTTKKPLLPLFPKTNSNQFPTTQSHDLGVWKNVLIALGIIVGLAIAGFILFKCGYLKINNNVVSHV